MSSAVGTSWTTPHPPAIRPLGRRSEAGQQPDSASREPDACRTPPSGRAGLSLPCRAPAAGFVGQQAEERLASLTLVLRRRVELDHRPPASPPSCRAGFVSWPATGAAPREPDACPPPSGRAGPPARQPASHHAAGFVSFQQPGNASRAWRLSSAVGRAGPPRPPVLRPPSRSDQPAAGSSASRA